MKLFKNYISSFFIFLLIFSSANTFAHFGSKGPYGGTVTCSITYDTTVYMGTANGGVFESTTSKLVAWRARPVGLKSGRITALTHSGKELYAGTADSGVYIFNGYVGTDRYWQKINNGLGNLQISSLLAIDSLTILAGTNNGLFKTTNKGASWTQISNATLNGQLITAMVKSNDQLFLTALDKGVFISTDKGTTWTDFNDSNTLNIPGATHLSFNEATHQLMVMNGNGILLTAVAASNPVASYGKIGTPLNTLIYNISNNGSTWLLATNGGVFVSLSGTISWTAINNGLPAAAIPSIRTIVPFQTTLVAGTIKEGIFKASAAAPSWVANNFGFNNLATYAMVCNGIAFVAAATEKGVFVSKDLANSYKASNKGLIDSLNVTDLVFSGTKLFAGTKNQGVFVSADSGSNWTALNAGLTSLNIKKLVASAAYVYLFTDAGEIFLLQGSNWNVAQTGLPAGFKPTSLVFYGSKVALGTYGNGVYTAIAGKNSWTAFNSNLNLNVTSVAAQGSKLFAGTDGDGVFVSDTASVNWMITAATSIPHTTLMGLNGKKIQAMATYGGYVWASYKGGLLASSDYGTTWIAGGNQFNLPSYTNVSKIDFVTTRVFVTSDNNGLYSNALSELPPTGIDEYANNIGTFNVYPNPSSGILTIDLSNIKGNATQIIVYDQAGKKVSAVQPHGFNVNLQLTIPSGIYYVQVISNEGTTAQKIVIN